MSQGTGALEWDIIRGSKIKDSEGTNRSAELAAALLEADFKTVLFSPEAKLILSSSPDLLEGLKFDPKQPQASSSTSPSSTDPLPQLIVAVALLHSFVQANWTGPDLPFSIEELLQVTADQVQDINAAAIPLLTIGGEPAYHLCQSPILLVLANRLLSAIPCSLKTLAWWKLRFHLVHLSLLDEPVELPQDVFQQVLDLEKQLPQDDPDLVARYHLELGLYHHRLNQDRLANQRFLTAARASGLEFELTGALGKKTKWQIDPRTQLVVLAESRERPDDKEYPTNSETSDSAEQNSGLPETLALNDDTLLEETEFTKLTSPDPKSPTSPTTSHLSHLDPAKQPPLYPLDQSLLLSLCLSQHNQLPDSGLTASQMMPFISRVVSHPRNWSIHTVALLLRSRLESNRSRTVERSALQLSALIDQMPTSDSTPKERLRWFHQLPLPSKWEMEKELAKRYSSLGVLRSALDIFTRLEMWEEVVACLQKLEKEDEAEKIVNDLLEGRKVESELVTINKREGISDSRRQKMSSGREAKLLCLLGDLALSADDASKDPTQAKNKAVEYYQTAWKVSGETSARAMRSLGSLHFMAREYEEVVPCLKASLEINPLYGRTWFALGVSLVKLERWSEAKEAFRREVGVDEEDAEGWNNLAAVYLRLHEERKESDENSASTTPFEDKVLAFRALRQGLRFAPTNWRMWSNYTIIALDVGELSESARAMTKVIDIKPPSQVNSDGSPESSLIDVEVLDKLVDSVTRDDYSIISQGTVVPKSSNEGFGLLPTVERLFDKSILPKVSDSPRIWRAHARLLRWKEDWSGALEDYLRAYRCGPAVQQGIETDKEKFKEGAEELEELVALLQSLGPKVKRSDGEKGGDWRFQARGLVRTFVGRTKASFEDEPEMDRLKELLNDLKRSE